MASTRSEPSVGTGGDGGGVEWGDFGWAMGAVLRAYMRVAEALVKDLPGGARGYQVLAAVAQVDAFERRLQSHVPGERGADAGRRVNQGELARQLGIDRTVFTYLVDDLVASGLVERRPDPADRRRRSIELTSPGRESLIKHRSALNQIEEVLLAPLGSDAEMFRDLLRRLAPATAEEDRMADLCRIAEDLGVTPPGSATA